MQFAQQAHVNWLHVSQDVRLKATQSLPGSCLTPAHCEYQSPVCFALRKTPSVAQGFYLATVPQVSPSTIKCESVLPDRKLIWSLANEVNSVVTGELTLSPDTRSHLIKEQWNFKETSASPCGGVFVPKHWCGCFMVQQGPFSPLSALLTWSFFFIS